MPPARSCLTKMREWHTVAAKTVDCTEIPRYKSRTQPYPALCTPPPFLQTSPSGARRGRMHTPLCGRGNPSRQAASLSRDTQHISRPASWSRAGHGAGNGTEAEATQS